jgi:hypothetical protein
MNIPRLIAAMNLIVPVTTERSAPSLQTSKGTVKVTLQNIKKGKVFCRMVREENASFRRREPAVDRIGCVYMNKKSRHGLMTLSGGAIVGVFVLVGPTVVMHPHSW